ncbi:hypothetical protein NUW58_g9584 [Xylaria curta]|uniref:Uncharacterized protein n=1 Tax=Xylaria curta TaxID=42375 RepID=A0ACC1MVY9_9PEZI|nr:hypothetical protein NUW58_g9584 [Xylaria curta]
MAVSPTSQCYQAVRRHLRPHYDSIWVPDNLLASAFERYAATFRTGARYGSSVPGPMEHRKRLAKRHMGELHFGQSHSAAPIWELANLVDLTQWQWKPPTSSDVRSRQHVNTATMPAPSEAMLSPFRLPFIQRTDITDDPYQCDQILLPKHITLSGVGEQLPSVSWGADSTPLDVIGAALESLSRDISKNTGIPLFFSRFCDGWKQALADGLFQGEAVSKVLTGVSEGLNDELIGAYYPRGADRFKLALVEATIEGLSRARTNEATPFDHVTWNSILYRISTIQMNAVRVFTKAITCVPQSRLREVTSGILDNLYAFFNALGRSTKRSTLARQAAKMTIPMQTLGLHELRLVVDVATRKALEYANVDGVNYQHIRSGWLQLIARLPSMDEQSLARICVTLEGDLAGTPLTEPEICELFLVWTNNRTPLRRIVDLRHVLRNKGTKCYYPFSLWLWRAGQSTRVKDFCTFLHAIRRENDVTIVAKAVIDARRGPLQLGKVALGMRRPRVAIDILCLYEESQRCKSSFWESEFGFKALEMLIWVPNFNYSRLWGILGIRLGRQLKTRRHGPPQKLCRGQVAKIVAVGIVAGLSPQITSRKAFALLASCCVYLRKHRTKVPLPVLRALVYDVTIPLTEGRPGVTLRLQYVLSILDQQIGRAQAQRVGMVMEQRRKANFRLA